jgi:hypothetical protein
VRVLVELLKTVGLDIVVDVATELGLVALLVVVGEGLHIFSDVTTEDVLAEGLGVKLLALNVVTGEAVLGVGNKDTTVGATLHGTKDTGTGGGTGETDIQENLEWAALLTVNLGGLSKSELTVSLLNTDEVLVQLELFKDAAGEEETGGVGSGPVGKTVGDTVGLQLVSATELLAMSQPHIPSRVNVLSGHENLVTANLRVDDLGNDVLVGETDDEAVLGRIVLVLGLGDQPLTGIVVGCMLLDATLRLGDLDTYSFPLCGACT